MTKIYTIGYGNRNLNTFINLLKEYEITYLIDVRSYPNSRFNANFNRSTISIILKNIGIKYLFMGDSLGRIVEKSRCFGESYQ